MDPLTPLSALRFTREYEEIKAVVRKFEGRQGEMFPIKSAMEEEQLASAEPAHDSRRGDPVGPGRARRRGSATCVKGGSRLIFVSQGPADDVRVRRATSRRRCGRSCGPRTRGNVTINVFDPRGLAGEGRRLTRHAAAARGRDGRPADHQHQRLRAGLEEVIGDASAYYLLGYTPTRTEDDGKFHKISVKVKRPGVDVLARKGYWAPGPEGSGRRRAADRGHASRCRDWLRRCRPWPPRRRASVDIWVGISRPMPSGRPACCW